MGITGDAETTLPLLIQAIEKEMTPARTERAAARGQKLKDAGREVHQGDPCSRPRSAGMPVRSQPPRTLPEVWNQIKNEDCTMASEANFLSNWPYRLWEHGEAL